MQATARWFNSLNADAHESRFGRSILSGYTADYAEQGAGPPLVLIPGLAGGTALLDPLAGALAPHFHVIRYELRAESDCFSLRRRFGFDELVRDLDEFLEEKGLERPLLMGVSFGGMLALRFAATRPGRLAGLIAQGVDVRFQRSLFRQVAGRVLRDYPLPANSPFVNQFFNLLFGGKQRNRLLVDFVTRQSWQTDQSVMAHRFRLVEELDLSADLPSIHLPTLLLAGGRDVLTSSRGLAELAEGIAGARVARLPSAGHLAFTTHAEPMAREIMRFALENGWVSEAAAAREPVVE